MSASVCQRETEAEWEICICVAQDIVYIGCVCKQRGEHSRFVERLSAGQKDLSDTHAYRPITQAADSINSIAHILDM